MNDLFYNKKFINQREQKSHDLKKNIVMYKEKTQKMKFNFIEKTTHKEKEIDNFRELYTTEIKNNRELRKHERRMGNKINQLLLEAKVYKNKIEKIKKRSSYVYDENVELKKRNKDLVNANKLFQDKTKRLEQDICLFQTELEDKLNFINDENKVLKSTAQSYKDKYTYLVNNPDSIYSKRLDKILDINKGLGERIDDLNRIINKLNQEKIDLQERSKINSDSLGELVGKIEKFVTIENYHVHRDRINELIKHMMKIESLMWRKQYGIEAATANLICGMVSNIHGKVVFKDFAGKSYHINNMYAIPNNTHVFCNAEIIDDNSINVLHYIETNDLPNNHRISSIKKSENKVKSRLDSIVYDFNFNINVLLLTGRGDIGKAYRNYLRHMKIKASWVDPFEKGIQSISLLMQKVDIVILFSDAMPHALLDYIDKEDKFQIMTNYNYKTLYNRVRYAAIQLNLK